MIAVIWGFMKVIPAFISTWRWAFIAVGVLTAAITAFNYIDNHGEMKATIDANAMTIERQEDTILALKEKIINRDVRLQKVREEKLAEVVQARVRLAEANILITDLRAKQEQIQKELEVTRFETLEAIRDDEEMADWVDHTVPSVAWSLLRAAAEGRSGD